MASSTWQLTDQGLFRQFRFQTFSELTLFLAAIGPVADGRDHHPDIKIHRAVLLDVHLLTHDKKAVTEKDHALADLMDELYERDYQ